MSTLQINLPDQTVASAAARATADGFRSVDDYIARLVEADVAGATVGLELEAELLAGLDGVGRPMTGVDWHLKRQRLIDQAGR